MEQLRKSRKNELHIAADVSIPLRYTRHDDANRERGGDFAGGEAACKIPFPPTTTPVMSSETSEERTSTVETSAE